MIRALVLKYGRPKTWAILIAGPLLTVAAIMVVILGVRAALPQPVDPYQPLGPNEALAQGGHTVEVRLVCRDTGEPLLGARFEVSTLDGRWPSDTGGPLAGNLAQVVVGPDWIGRVGLRWKDPETGDDQRVTTDLIGEPYGWNNRVVAGPCPPAMAPTSGD